MALRLPRFLRSIALVEKDGTPSLAFHQWWDTTLKQIEQSVLDIQLALAAAGIAIDNVGVVPPFNTRTVTTTTLVLASDYLVLVDASAGGVTINLPSAASKDGRSLVIKKIDSTANVVTIDPSGSETIDGAATKDLTTQYQKVHLASSGISWWEI